MKKNAVLISLFVLPVLIYVFFASGVYNFDTLPLVVENVEDIKDYNFKEVNTDFNDTAPLQLEDKVTIIGYLGEELKANAGYTANLNLTIYKYYQGFEEFQVVFLVAPGTEGQVKQVKEELSRVTDVKKLRFVSATPEQARRHFKSLNVPLLSTKEGYSPFVFLIDKKRNIRSRNDELKKMNIYGYDLTQAVEMGYLKEDVKVILAENRKALKKNGEGRRKKIEYKKR